MGDAECVGGNAGCGMRNAGWVVHSAGCVALAVALSAGAGAQQQVQTIQIGPGGGEGMSIQLPQPGRQLKTGTGRIRGRLTTADTGTPVRRAQVRISGSDIMPKTAVSDADGRYEFRDLPAGRFNINAAKAGFVTINYGQTRPFEPGKPIDLADAQLLDKADITMPRGSVIGGRIVDEFGEPVADVAVGAMRSAWVNGKRRLQSTGRMSQTNDLGQYRIYGLPPGEYYVSATLRGGVEMMVMETVAATMFSGGGGSPSGSDLRSGYAPTYYPGTSNGAEAQKIQLALGQEMQGADFSLLPVRLARISGMVVGSDGKPIEGAMLQGVPRSEAGALAFPMAGASRSDRNGQFTLNGVAPGEYTLQVRGTQVISTSSGGDTMMFSTRIGGGDGQAEFGSVPLVVAGEDVSNVVVLTSKGTSVSGRVVFEGGRPANTAPLRIAAATIESDVPFGPGGGSSSITPEGGFEIKNVLGPRLIRATGLPAGWMLKSVTAGGTDITDTGLTLKPNEPIGGVEVVLTSRATHVAGGVTDGGQPATDYTVVIFSEDAEKWSAPMTRHVTGVRPNQQGRFEARNLPAGAYYAVGLDYIAQGDWNDPDVLERLKSKATRFTLADGGAQTLDLRLTRN